MNTAGVFWIYKIFPFLKFKAFDLLKERVELNFSGYVLIVCVYVSSG